MFRLNALLGSMLAASLLLGCRHGARDAKNSDATGPELTAAAEARAEEATLTSAEVETASAPMDRDAAQQERRAHDESLAAFGLEQADLRGRLRVALDALDQAIAVRRAAGAGRGNTDIRELFERRARLATDLELLNRTGEADWAVVRSKVERDLDTARGAQVMPLR